MTLTANSLTYTDTLNGSLTTSLTIQSIATPTNNFYTMYISFGDFGPILADSYCSDVTNQCQFYPYIANTFVLESGSGSSYTLNSISSTAINKISLSSTVSVLFEVFDQSGKLINEYTWSSLTNQLVPLSISSISLYNNPFFVKYTLLPKLMILYVSTTNIQMKAYSMDMMQIVFPQSDVSSISSYCLSYYITETTLNLGCTVTTVGTNYVLIIK